MRAAALTALLREWPTKSGNKGVQAQFAAEALCSDTMPRTPEQHRQRPLPDTGAPPQGNNSHVGSGTTFPFC